jgi:hypothetical protein
MFSVWRRNLESTILTKVKVAIGSQFFLKRTKSKIPMREKYAEGADGCSSANAICCVQMYENETPNAKRQTPNAKRR